MAEAAGTSSGSLIHVMSYGPDDLEEARPARLIEARPYRGRRPVTWVNVDSSSDAEILRSLNEDFGVHPLTVEDVRNTRQRPKIEAYKGYVYVVTRMLTRDEDGTVRTEQLSLILGPDWLITLTEDPGDVFDDVRTRLRSDGSAIRAGGADYLLYALLDAIVDSYFPVLEAIGSEAEEIEDAILEDETAGVRDRLQGVRRGLLTLHRVAWPQRDALAALERGDAPFIRTETRAFLRDVSDHATRVIDFVETNREFLSNLMDLHLATVAQRTSDVTKVLTIVATIFIPLTFIVGVYGMNFDTSAGPLSMPELEWRYGYVAVLAFMAALALGMLAAFRRKGWI